DFQPAPGRVRDDAIQHLQDVASLAEASNLSLIVTLFTGHMSGVNWLPEWAVADGGRLPTRFPVFSNGKLAAASPRNWYTDAEVLDSQMLLAHEVAGALRRQPGLWAYDLGNENSNCVVPPSRESAVWWLESMAAAIRSVDSDHEITLGLHSEDLEEDRHLG